MAHLVLAAPQGLSRLGFLAALDFQVGPEVRPHQLAPVAPSPLDLLVAQADQALHVVPVNIISKMNIHSMIVFTHFSFAPNGSYTVFIHINAPSLLIAPHFWDSGIQKKDAFYYFPNRIPLARNKENQNKTWQF